MKTIILLLLGLFLNTLIYAQYSEIYVYSNEGERFLLLIDGKMYNEKPETAVTAKEYCDETCIITIKFENKDIRSISKKTKSIACW